MHGHSDEDFHRELDKAQAANDTNRIHVLRAAHEIVEHVDYEHFHTVVDLKRLQDVVASKVHITELLVERYPIPQEDAS